MYKVILSIGLVSLLASCGGSGSSSSSFDDVDGAGELPDDILAWQEGLFLEKKNFEDFCAVPRTGANPFDNNRPFPDKQGSAEHEKFYLRSWTNELYLWYDEVEDQDPTLFESTASYFAELVTTDTTPTGAAKDNFHFTENTETYLTRTVAGVTFGYGLNLVAFSTRPPREFRVQDVVPGSAADTAGITRGMLITAIDGADFINGNDTATLNDGLFPGEVGEDHTFSLQAYGANDSVDFVLRSSSVTAVPVKYTRTVATETGDVGYIHFNTHSRPSEKGLYDAFSQLAAEGVTDLVLDLRYNGGGLLDIAAEVAYMIAGPNRTANKGFYTIQFNDQHPDRDPVSGAALDPINFHASSRGFASDLARGTSLPNLGLSRVFILASGGTCSASEAIINGLRGIDIDVVFIGDTTCGKPYGFYPQDNCGTTYFSIQFTGINDLGFGEYPSGFSPANKPNLQGVSVPGCYVQDDFSKLLGDPDEAMFAAALQYRTDGSCPSVPVASAKRLVTADQTKPSVGGVIELPANRGMNTMVFDLPQ